MSRDTESPQTQTQTQLGPQAAHRRGHDTAVIGLTGGIASGKSTVAAIWRERGARIIDADQVARDVVAPGEPALDAIAAFFGADVIQADGRLDRAKLGSIVFADPASLARLNAITHPAIMGAVGRALVEARRDRLPWVVYAAALVLENGLAPGLTELVIVVAPEDVQRSRLMDRNGLTAAQAQQRMNAQTDNAARREAADRLIDNGSDLAALSGQAEAVFEEIVKAYGALSSS